MFSLLLSSLLDDCKQRVNNMSVSRWMDTHTPFDTIPHLLVYLVVIWCSRVLSFFSIQSLSLHHPSCCPYLPFVGHKTWLILWPNVTKHNVLELIPPVTWLHLSWLFDRKSREWLSFDLWLRGLRATQIDFSAVMPIVEDRESGVDRRNSMKHHHYLKTYGQRWNVDEHTFSIGITCNALDLPDLTLPNVAPGMDFA